MYDDDICGACSTNGRDEKHIDCRVLVRTPEGKRIHGRSRRRWDDNINLDLKEIRCEDVDWIFLAHNKVLVGRSEPMASITGGEFLDQLIDC